MRDDILERAFALVKNEVREALAADTKTAVGRHKADVARQEFLGELSGLAEIWFDDKIKNLRRKGRPERESAQGHV